MRELEKEMNQTKEELKLVKGLNRIAAVIIVLQLVFMAYMVHNAAEWNKDFEQMQSKYEQLQEDLGGLYE